MQKTLSTLFFLIFSVFTLAACQTVQPADPNVTTLHQALQEHKMATPKTTAYKLCHGHGCRLQDEISLSKKEWRKVKSAFRPRAKTPAKEREQIKKAIALMETYSGKKTGTDKDTSGSFGSVFQKGQLDCEDEMLNAGMYFILFENNKLIRHHKIAGQANRGMFLNGWPHKAVHLTEIKSGQSYVLDSWFHDNGKPAEIIDFKLWKSGWKPAKKAQ